MPLSSPNPDSKNARPGAAVVFDAAILELLASRICHDLISPVGAVHNGIEFLEDMGLENGAEAINLIAQSAQIATARLQAFRLTYGAGGRDPNIKPEDVHKTFAALIAGDKKVTQDWDPHAPLGFADELPTGLCKILMGTMMLAQECLPKGGTVSVTPGAPGEVLVSAISPDPLLREQVEDALALAIEPANLDPRLVHPYAVSLLARHYGFSLAIATKGNGRIAFSLSVKSSS